MIQSSFSHFVLGLQTFAEKNNLLKGPLPRAPSHSLRWHCCTSQPALSFPQREVTNKQTKQTKQSRTKTNRQFISQNQRSGKTQGWILFELAGWSSLRMIFLEGFLLLLSDPAPIKVYGDVVITNPQHCKRVRSYIKGLGSFSLYQVTKFEWVILSLAEDSRAGCQPAGGGGASNIQNPSGISSCSSSNC